MNKHPSIALLFVAILIVTTGAKGQNVYRCGNSYSQKPCTDGVVIDVQDTRTPAQKADSDALAKRRRRQRQIRWKKHGLKEESRQRAEPAKTAGTTKNGSSKARGESSDSAAMPASKNGAKTAKKPHQKEKEPQYFTARADKPQSKASASK